MSFFRFTPAFANPQGSPIRELFPYLSRPGMISLAGGYPSPSLFDQEGLATAAAQAMTTGATALQYGATEGSPALREQLAAQCQARGIRCAASDVLVTTGSQQGFDLLLRVLVQPGDVVCVETPAYPATIAALRQAGARILSTPVDGHGLNLDALQVLLEELPEDERPRLLYTVPNFSNPCGTLLTQERRTRLVQLALQYGFVVVEDDPYGELAFTDQRPAPVYAAAQQLLQEQRGEAEGENPVVYLSSLSKTVAPGLRVGWMVADPAVLRRSIVAKQTNDLCTSPLAQAVAASYLQSGRYAQAVAAACAEYRRRMQALTDGMKARLGDLVQFVQPAGGMFVWLTFDKGIDPQKLFDAAVAANVIFVPGKAFYADNADLHSMRLSFAAPDVAQIEQAVERLAQAFEKAR
ncbi:aminotransferase-like domain-containing protein [Comamonas odontotermitis]|uniref:aminotransferase-like domain-containing protein n=1 Tax=Comamonas odontotermitis TaxID=379895 RepID=UPI001CC7977C|nr:PLP-dependent aminotransferase family protein [Comamonas odontotermitis]UBB16614.1 PLP-dependent aminotransferase family protein [Comamonas odontotermitis]